MERLMDRIAQQVGLDPAEVRRRNFIQPEQMPYPVGLVFRDGSPVVYDSGDYPECQAKSLELAPGTSPDTPDSRRCHKRPDCHRGIRAQPDRASVPVE